jgi:hypothetical protein
LNVWQITADITKTQKEKSMATKSKKLELVSAANLATSNALAIISGKVPEKGKLKKLNLPPLVKFGDKNGQIGVGITVSGVLVGLVNNFTGKDEMKGTQTVHLKHESGEEYLIPLTGGIKSTFRQLLESDEKTVKPQYIGKTFFFTRRSDGVSKKYNGKAMFNVDVVVSE